MSTYLLATDGRTNELGCVLYDLSKDGDYLNRDVTYDVGYSAALADAKPGDRYRESCEGVVYCDQSIEEVRADQAKREEYFLGRRA